MTLIFLNNKGLRYMLTFRCLTLDKILILKLDLITSTSTKEFNYLRLTGYFKNFDIRDWFHCINTIK